MAKRLFHLDALSNNQYFLGKKIEKLIDNSKPTSASVQTPEISKNLNSIDSLKSIMSKLKK
jgi:uncharacterized protein YajQ (UPF0234 family)